MATALAVIGPSTCRIQQRRYLLVVRTYWIFPDEPGLSLSVRVLTPSPLLLTQ
jgi:hypothetical protein